MATFVLPTPIGGSGGGGGGGAASGALVRKRILTVNGGEPFLRITESLGLAPFPDSWLSLVQADYDGPLALTKDIVSFRVAFIGGGSGGFFKSPGNGKSYGGLPGDVYLMEGGKLSDMPEAFYLFVGDGGYGGFTPDLENGIDGLPGSGSSSQFYGFSAEPGTPNEPQATGGYPPKATDEEMAQTHYEMIWRSNIAMPNPTTMPAGGFLGTKHGPGYGGTADPDSYSYIGGAAYFTTPALYLGPNFSEGEAGIDVVGDHFAACGSGGNGSFTNGIGGGRGGRPGGGGGGYVGDPTAMAGDGGRGEIHIEFSILEIA